MDAACLNEPIPPTPDLRIHARIEPGGGYSPSQPHNAQPRAYAVPASSARMLYYANAGGPRQHRDAFLDAVVVNSKLAADTNK